MLFGFLKREVGIFVTFVIRPQLDSKTKMKKILLALAVSLFVGVLFTACHAYEECPAYGQIEPTQEVENS